MTATLADKLDERPDLPGVYLFGDVSGGVLYVGKAQSLKRVLAVAQVPQPAAACKPARRRRVPAPA